MHCMFISIRRINIHIKHSSKTKGRVCFSCIVAEAQLGILYSNVMHPSMLQNSRVHILSKNETYNSNYSSNQIRKYQNSNQLGIVFFQGYFSHFLELKQNDIFGTSKTQTKQCRNWTQTPSPNNPNQSSTQSQLKHST